MAALVGARVLRRSLQRLLLTPRTGLGGDNLFQSRGHRLGPTDDEMYQRTSVTVMQREAGGEMLILSYSSSGFNINGNRVFGPCAVLPLAILQWNVGSHDDITEESVSLFHMLVPGIGKYEEMILDVDCVCNLCLFVATEILVVGTGTKLERIKPPVLALLKKKGIAVEVQDTPNACATFNFLVSERRIAAAALIPPAASTALQLTEE
ncbi:LOW QUALITY PROTEIN: NADH dehydrogenase [ubiquinone] 1 alpha subcomplex assembly factor 3 [Neosynchiropus ocellatus]